MNNIARSLGISSEELFDSGTDKPDVKIPRTTEINEWPGFCRRWSHDWRVFIT
jgi:hypothetical protein